MQEIANMRYFYDTDQQHFRILWASPYVAHQKNPYPANSFLMSQMAPLNPLNPNDFFFVLSLIYININFYIEDKVIITRGSLAFPICLGISPIMKRTISLIS